MNYEARFGGIGRLYGNSGLSLLKRPHSRRRHWGVGSWAAEALARSGVGTIILMDMDDLCIPTPTGKYMRWRPQSGNQNGNHGHTPPEINPEAEVIPISNFYTASTRKNCCRRNRTSSLTPSTP
ncbi:MAG: hypothetical protein ACLSUW_04955 [Akkermansia sp.]